MPIAQSNSPSSVTLDGAYVYVAPQNTPPVPPNTSIGGMVGFATDGPFNSPTLVSNQALNATFGIETLNQFDLVTQAQVYFKQAQLLSIVRVKDGTETAAVASIVDGTGYAAGLITIAGSFSAATVISGVITNGTNAVNYTYTTVAGDTNIAGVCASLAKAINATLAVNGSTAFLQTVTATATTVVPKANFAGAAGNAITITASAVGGTVTATATSPFAGGAAPGVLATLTAKYAGSGPNNLTWQLAKNALSTVSAPLWDFTIQKSSYTNAETWQAIPAPSTATFIVNLVAAVNTGTTQRGPSVYFVATSGASSGAIGAQAVSGASTLGTDTTTITTSTLIGVDGNSNRTGMFALRGSGVNAFVLSGCTDRAADAPIAAFALSEGIAMGGNGYASGTDPVAANNAITTSPVGLFRFVNWLGFASTIQTGKRRLWPGGAALATIVSTPPQNSVGDRPLQYGYPAVIDSEYTAELGPISTGQAYVAQQAGLLYLTTNTPQAGGVFAFPHGQAASPTPGLSQVSDQRLNNYLAQDLLRVLGPFVHQLQSTQVDDQFRALVVNTLQARYATMIRSRIIADAQVIDTLGASTGAGQNSPTSIAQGFNFLQVIITPLVPVRDIIATLNVSATQVFLNTAGSTSGN